MTHREYSKLARNASAVPCNASHMTFGGRCLNCGWTQPTPVNSFDVKVAAKRLNDVSQRFPNSHSKG